MDIEEIEKTPNPDSMKFTLDRSLTPPFQTASFTAGDDRPPDPAGPVLDEEGVEKVTFQGNWMTVKAEDEWDRDLLDRVKEAVESSSSDDQVDAGRESLLDEDLDRQKDPRLELIEMELKDKVMPFLYSHGGSLKIVDLENDTLMIEYQGACGGCPISISQTLARIESLLQQEVDPDLDVQALNTPDSAPPGF